MIRTPHSITIPGKPAGKARPRVGQGGHFYSPKAGAFEAKVVQLAQQAWGTTPDDALYQIKLLIVKRISNSVSQKKRQAMFGCYAGQRPDPVNILAACLDSLQGILYHDDKQVPCHVVRQIWGTADFTVISVKDISAETWSQRQ